MEDQRTRSSGSQVNLGATLCHRTTNTMHSSGVQKPAHRRALGAKLSKVLTAQTSDLQSPVSAAEHQSEERPEERSERDLTDQFDDASSSAAAATPAQSITMSAPAPAQLTMEVEIEKIALPKTIGGPARALPWVVVCSVISMGMLAWIVIGIRPRGGPFLQVGPYCKHCKLHNTVPSDPFVCDPKHALYTYSTTNDSGTTGIRPRGGPGTSMSWRENRSTPQTGLPTAPYAAETSLNGTVFSFAFTGTCHEDEAQFGGAKMSNPAPFIGLKHEELPPCPPTVSDCLPSYGPAAQAMTTILQTEGAPMPVPLFGSTLSKTPVRRHGLHALVAAQSPNWPPNPNWPPRSHSYRLCPVQIFNQLKIGNLQDSADTRDRITKAVAAAAGENTGHSLHFQPADLAASKLLTAEIHSGNSAAGREVMKKLLAESLRGGGTNRGALADLPLLAPGQPVQHGTGRGSFLEPKLHSDHCIIYNVTSLQHHDQRVQKYSTHAVKDIFAQTVGGLLLGTPVMGAGDPTGRPRPSMEAGAKGMLSNAHASILSAVRVQPGERAGTVSLEFGSRSAFKLWRQLGQVQLVAGQFGRCSLAPYMAADGAAIAERAVVLTVPAPFVWMVLEQGLDPLGRVLNDIASRVQGSDVLLEPLGGSEPLASLREAAQAPGTYVGDVHGSRLSSLGANSFARHGDVPLLILPSSQYGKVSILAAATPSLEAIPAAGERSCLEAHPGWGP